MPRRHLELAGVTFLLVARFMVAEDYAGRLRVFEYENIPSLGSRSHSPSHLLSDASTITEHPLDSPIQRAQQIICDGTMTEFDGCDESQAALLQRATKFIKVKLFSKYGKYQKYRKYEKYAKYRKYQKYGKILKIWKISKIQKNMISF